MDNKFTISADIDTQQAEKKLSELEKRIKAMRETGPGGNISQLAQQYRATGQEDRARRLEQFREREAKQSRRELMKDLESQKKSLDDLLNKENRYEALIQKRINRGAEYTKQLEKQNELKQRIAQTTKAIVDAESQINGGGRGLGDIMGGGVGPFSGYQTARIAAGYRMGGVARGAGELLKQGMRIPGLVGGGIGLAGKAVEYGGNLAFNIGTEGERKTAKEADIAGMLGESSRLQAQRRGYEMQLYSGERSKALEAALTRKDFSQMRDTTSIVGGMMKGAGYGAAAGSFLGGIGAIPGAIGGAAIGLVGTVGSNLMSDERRSAMGSALGIESQEDFYEKIKSGEAAKVYEQQLALEKRKNYEKVEAQKYLEKNSGRFRRLQRTFGLSDEDLFQGEGSLFQRGAQAGFVTDTIARNMEQISGAGGTTRMGAEGAIMASQMERGLNLTNAGSLLGRISGATGMGGQGSKDELIRMYAEATRLGLDDSDFAKETRTFLDTAANMAYESGADFQTTANLLGQGMGLYSERGIQASQNALNQLKQETGQMGGLTGQYQIGELQSEKMKEALGGQGLSLEETAMISGMDITRVSEKDDYIKTILSRRGIEAGSDQAKDIIKQIKQGKVRSTLRTDEQEKAYEEYSQLLNAPANPEALRDAESRLRELGVLTGGEREARRGIQEQKSLVRMKAGTLGGKGTAGTAVDRGGFEDAMAAATGGIVDKMEGAKAMDDLGQLKNLADKMPELASAFDGTTTASVALRGAMEGLVEAMKKGNVEIVKEYEKIIENYRAQQDNQALYDFGGQGGNSVTLPNLGKSE